MTGNELGAHFGMTYLFALSAQPSFTYLSLVHSSGPSVVKVYLFSAANSTVTIKSIHS